jgi:hypothetical protein
MTEDPMRDLTVSNMAPRPGESNTAYRERIAVLQAETLDCRQQELTSRGHLPKPQRIESASGSVGTS